jgi:molybdopterin-guanine dinucleotide biosynthesis protein A
MIVGGVVLAGGRSHRMGVDKATLDWRGVPLVVRVASLVRGSVDGPVVVVAAPGRALPALPAGIELAVDAIEGQGPLEGLLAGLGHLEGRAELALVTGVDAALLVPVLAGDLAAALGDEDVCAGVIDGWLQPLPGVYRVALAERVRTLRADGHHALRHLLEVSAVSRVDENDLRRLDPELDSYRRLNTPDELAAALAATSSD